MSDVEVFAPSETLPDLRQAEDVVATLVSEGAAQTLDEGRRRAETGLGALSYDDPHLIEALDRKKMWRALAAAFERGKLLHVCNGMVAGDKPLFTTNVAREISGRGYTFAPGRCFKQPFGARYGSESIPWGVARRLAKEDGLALHRIPADRAYVKQLRAERLAKSQRMRAVHREARTRQRANDQRAMTTAARERGPKADEAYAKLRSTLSALEAARRDFVWRDGDVDNGARICLDHAFAHLYKAEDWIGAALGLRGRPYDGEN